MPQTALRSFSSNKIKYSEIKINTRDNEDECVVHDVRKGADVRENSWRYQNSVRQF